MVYYAKEERVNQNHRKCKTSLSLGYTLSKGCAVTNSKLLRKSVYWWSQWKKVVPKLLLQVSVREIRNNLVIPTEEVGLKEAQNKTKIPSTNTC